MAILIISFFLQAVGAAPVVVPPQLVTFLVEVLRYLMGVGIVALAGACAKIWKDNLSLKRDVAILKKQRSADLIERDSVLTMATAIKNETSNLKSEFDGKLKDLMHLFSTQQNEDREMMKDMIHEVKLTLVELNTTIKGVNGINR